MTSSSDQSLAAAAGIPVSILRAIRQIESGGTVNAVRFEPHIFNRITNGRYETFIPFTPDPDRGVSLVRAETNRAAFEFARTFDGPAAVRATSWGRYQVLGGHLLDVAPNDPVGAFDANPSDVSDALLVSWFQGRPAARTAAQRGDIDELARLYNGSERWARRLREALANPRAAEQERQANERPSAVPVWGLLIGASLGAAGLWAWDRWGPA